MLKSWLSLYIGKTWRQNWEPLIPDLYGSRPPPPSDMSVAWKTILQQRVALKGTSLFQIPAQNSSGKMKAVMCKRRSVVKHLRVSSFASAESNLIGCDQAFSAAWLGNRACLSSQKQIPWLWNVLRISEVSAVFSENSGLHSVFYCETAFGLIKYWLWRADI